MYWAFMEKKFPVEEIDSFIVHPPWISRNFPSFVPVPSPSPGNPICLLKFWYTPWNSSFFYFMKYSINRGYNCLLEMFGTEKGTKFWLKKKQNTIAKFLVHLCSLGNHLPVITFFPLYNKDQRVNISDFLVNEFCS